MTIPSACAECPVPSLSASTSWPRLHRLVGAFTLALAMIMASGAYADVDPSSAPTEGVAAAPAPITSQYGVGLRAPRWISVPSWLLGLFTAQNVPLSTFGSVGGEFILRRGDYDIVFGLGYQNMSTHDGNWLGKSKDPSLDTDLLQFRNLSLIGVDAAFIKRRMFTDRIGVHYGAGLGVAIVRGELLRTSDWTNCTSANAGNTTACRPRICPASGCTEAILKASEGGVDGPDSPSRFKERDVPGAVPIINVTLGVDLRFPEVKGLEAHLEGGFYDAFFLGLSLAYLFH